MFVKEKDTQLNIGSVIWGIFFIVLGCLLVADKIFKLDLFSPYRFWPIFVILQCITQE